MDPLAEKYSSWSSYNFTMNNPINLKDPNGMWVEGAGFWNNLLYSDQRNEAMLLAGENGSFWKTKNGWRVSRPTQQQPVQRDVYFTNEVLDEVEVFDILDNESNFQSLGKTPGKDKKQGKSTLLTINNKVKLKNFSLNEIKKFKKKYKKYFIKYPILENLINYNIERIN